MKRTSPGSQVGQDRRQVARPVQGRDRKWTEERNPSPWRRCAPEWSCPGRVARTAGRDPGLRLGHAPPACRCRAARRSSPGPGTRSGAEAEATARHGDHPRPGRPRGRWAHRRSGCLGHGRMLSRPVAGPTARIPPAAAAGQNPGWCPAPPVNQSVRRELTPPEPRTGGCVLRRRSAPRHALRALRFPTVGIAGAGSGAGVPGTRLRGVR